LKSLYYDARSEKHQIFRTNIKRAKHIIHFLDHNRTSTQSTLRGHVIPSTRRCRRVRTTHAHASLPLSTIVIYLYPQLIRTTFSRTADGAHVIVSSS